MPCLALSRNGTFGFAHEGETLQNQIGDKGSHQIFPLPSIKQRYIENYNPISLVRIRH